MFEKPEQLNYYGTMTLYYPVDLAEIRTCPECGWRDLLRHADTGGSEYHVECEKCGWYANALEMARDEQAERNTYYQQAGHNE